MMDPDAAGADAGQASDLGLCRQVIETTPDIVYILNPEGVIVEANPPLCRLLRRSREKLLGDKVSAHLDRDCVAMTERVLKEIVKRRLPQRSTRSFQVPGSEPQTYEVMESPLLRDGQVWAIAGIGREITQEVVLERKLWDTRESRQWAVDFALRTALGLVRGYIYTLCQGGLADEERRTRYVKVIEEEIDHISKIIEDMLDIRRFEGGDLSLSGDVVGVGDCIAHVMLQFADEAQGRDIELEADVNRDMNPVCVPREALLRILHNLVQNAIHYTLHRGRVVVEARDHESYVEIHVRDNGVGIPEDEIPYIFEKYYRGKSISTSPTQGTGLGLAVTRTLVEALGGKVWVNSRVGAGCDFGVVIPRQPFGFNEFGEPESWKLTSATSDSATIV
jgi:two-component system sensor histidine kinase ResE